MKLTQLLGALLATVILLSAWSVVAVAQVKWDLSTAWPDGNFHTQNAKKFAEAVKNATGGAVEITVKSGGQLGFKGPEHLRAVRDGLVPMADILNIQQVGDEPILGIESIPFLAGSADELKVLHKYIRPIYEKVAERNNQKILYMVPWPTQYLHLKKEAKTIDDLQAVKIRVPDKGTLDLLASVGMSAVLIPWAEVVPALAAGAVDGVSTSAVSAVDGKFWEFLKASHATNHVWSSQIVTVNLDSWNSLSDDQRSQIEAIAREMEPGFWAISLESDTKSVATLEENGMAIIAVPPEMMAELRKRTEPQMNAFFEKVPEAKEPVMAYLAEMKR